MLWEGLASSCRCFSQTSLQLSLLESLPGMRYALSGQSTQAQDGDKSHFSVFRLRQTIGPIGMESSSPSGVTGTMLPPSPQRGTVVIGSSGPPEYFLNIPSPQKGGKVLPLSCCKPEVVASLPLSVFPCGLEDISPGWRGGSLVKRACYMAFKIRVLILAPT